MFTVSVKVTVVVDAGGTEVTSEVLVAVEVVADVVVTVVVTVEKDVVVKVEVTVLVVGEVTVEVTVVVLVTVVVTVEVTEDVTVVACVGSSAIAASAHDTPELSVAGKSVGEVTPLVAYSAAPPYPVTSVKPAPWETEEFEAMTPKSRTPDWNDTEVEAETEVPVPLPLAVTPVVVASDNSKM